MSGRKQNVAGLLVTRGSRSLTPGHLAAQETGMDILLRSGLGKHTYSTQCVYTRGDDDVGGRVKEMLVRTRGGEREL